MFNYNASEPKYSSRAGATYGLRLLAYVNTTEYLPITEAVGVRITIHDQNEFAFPVRVARGRKKLKNFRKLPAILLQPASFLLSA